MHGSRLRASGFGRDQAPGCRPWPAGSSPEPIAFPEPEAWSPKPVKWTDAEDIAVALREKFPNVDPLTVRFTDLRQWVLALPGFEDDPAASNEARLEAIQMAWYEEATDRD